MALIARLIMITVIGLLLFVVLGVSAMVWLENDYSGLFDLVDLDEDLPATTMGPTLATIATMVLIVACLTRAFWAVHQILKRPVQSDFLKLSHQLRICAFSLIAFWGAIQILLGPVSYLLIAHIPADIRPSVDYFPFELEAIYLILALPLLVTASALRRAADIEEENSQFL